MVQVDLPCSFLLGQVLAISSRKYLKHPGNKRFFTNRMLGILNVYMSCGFVPIGMFLIVTWPSWELMYVTGWAEKTYNNPPVGLFYIAFMMIMVLLGNAGYIVSHYLYQKGKERAVTLIAWIAGALTILPFLLRWGVWWQVGTFDMIQKGTGYSFFQPPFFYSWLGLMLYFLFTMTIAYRVSGKVSGTLLAEESGGA